MFTKAFGLKKFLACNNHNDILEILFQEVDRFNAPCDVYDIFVFNERIPIYTDLNNPSSSIRQSLYDRPGEVVLVADSFMMGFDGLHLITLTPSFLTINDWLQKSQQGKHEMYIRSIGSEDISLVSKLRSFIAS